MNYFHRRKRQLFSPPYILFLSLSSYINEVAVSSTAHKKLLPLLRPDFPNEMPERRNRMIPQHTRTRIAHNLAYLLPHIRLIAMNLAGATIAFFRTKRTAIESLNSVHIERKTIFAKLSSRNRMVMRTKDLNHLPHHHFISNDI